MSRPIQRQPSHVVMLLDNHFAPDRRVLREVQLLTEQHVKVTILAWDRRTAPTPETPSLPHGVRLARVNVPAPPGGGIRTFVALTRFGLQVGREFRSLLQRSDLLMVHDIYLLPLGVGLSHRLKIPFAYDAHEDFAIMERGRLPNSVLHAASALETLLARRATFIVVPGRVRQPRWIDAGFPPPILLNNAGVPTSKTVYSNPDGGATWDLAYCGLLDASRRLDLLVALAQCRPDLRIAIAGTGRCASEICQAGNALANLDFIGWTDDPDAMLKKSRAIYYGLDPENAYADAACPNNLYQAIRAQRPLIFFCGGEPAEVASQFSVGLRIPANVKALAAAVDSLSRRTDEWQFDAALRAIEAVSSGSAFIDAVLTALSPATRSTRRQDTAPITEAA